MGNQSSNSPVIRTMVPSDLDRIVEIDIKVRGKSRREYWEIKVGLDEKRPQVSSLVAEMDGHVIGFIIGYASMWEYGVAEKIGWIDTIGVDPVYQKKGIARILFTEMAGRLKKTGVDTIYTFVKRTDWKLLKFFDNMGFKKGDMENLALDI